MHVSSITALSVEQVNSRFRQLAEGALQYQPQRAVPKFFLHRVPITLPAAAEVHLESPASQTEVVLRLMWGGLPAPFPRAVAALGVVISALVLWLGGISLLTVALALVCAGAPIAALLYQRQGETRLQRQLQGLIEGTEFVHKPH